jgi:hypothetical protein
MPILSSIKTQQFVAILCSVILLPAQSLAWQDNQQAPSTNQQQQAPALTPDQLDSLVAPIALYPDPLLSQLLVASTYPLEIVECARWFDANSSLQGQALKDAVSKQPWDASVQALVAFPDVLKQLNTNISWTTDLGNAFLAQQADVMESIQRLRTKAQSAGKLTSNEQQKVTTSSSNGNTYIQIQPASPQVIYVPQYNPEAVWGAAPAYYPYPPIAYPPYYGAGAVAAGVISFGAGLAIGSIWGGGGGWGGWGWNAGWGGNNVVVNNNFINRNNFNRTNIGNGNTWQHNPAHRAGVPYSNSNLANRYGGNGNFNNRNGNFNRNDLNNVNRNNLNRNNVGQNANRNLNNAGQNANRNLNNMGQNANRNPGQNADRSMGQNANRNMGQMQNRGGQADRQTAGFGSGGGNQFGNRQMSSGGFGSGGANRSAFSGMSQGGGRTQMNSMRGGGSMGGGGFHGGGGGGGRGGGGRGGGGRR